MQIAWLIAFVASVISKIHGQFPNYSWWALVYMFFCIIGVLVTVASDSVFTYHVAVSKALCSRVCSFPCLHNYRSLAFWLLASSSQHLRSTPWSTRPTAHTKQLPLDSFSSPWSLYVSILFRCRKELTDIIDSDRLDLLLWFSAHRVKPQRDRLLRPSQRQSRTIAHLASTSAQQLPPRDLDLPATTNVHLSPA